MAYAGVHDTHDVLPVFLYDLSMRDETLLLDGVLQVMREWRGEGESLEGHWYVDGKRRCCGVLQHNGPHEVTRSFPIMLAIIETGRFVMGVA